MVTRLRQLSFDWVVTDGLDGGVRVTRETPYPPLGTGLRRYDEREWRLLSWQRVKGLEWMNPIRRKDVVTLLRRGRSTGSSRTGLEDVRGEDL